MSCMIMKAESLAALANAVETRLNCGYNYWGFETPDSLFQELLESRRCGVYFAERIYQKLYEVNARAYNGRYANHEEPADEEAPAIDVSKYIIHHPPEYREHGFAACPWHYQLAKLLDFWLYQTEEDATRSDPLRLAMGEFRDILYHFIVQNSPQYTELRWGELPVPDTGKNERSQRYIVQCYPSQAIGMIADLGNGPATANGDRSSQYFTIAKGRYHMDKTVSVALIENANGLPEGERYYTLHLINDVSGAPCELHHTKDLSEESLVSLLKEILENLENGSAQE